MTNHRLVLASIIMVLYGFACVAKPYESSMNRELISRIDALKSSCSRSSDDKLIAADRLMELIVHRITSIDSGRYTIERHIWEAGDLLFRLTIGLQQNNLTRSQCVTGVDIIKKKLFLKPWS
jgi:hypothetical protein